MIRDSPQGRLGWASVRVSSRLLALFTIGANWFSRIFARRLRRARPVSLAAIVAKLSSSRISREFSSAADLRPTTVDASKSHDCGAYIYIYIYIYIYSYIYIFISYIYIFMCVCVCVCVCVETHTNTHTHTHTRI